MNCRLLNQVMNYQQKKTSDLFEKFEEPQSFEEMQINKNIIRGLYSVGFDQPSKIQRKSVPVIKSGKDLIAQSQAGSGKTAAYVIGILNKIDIKSNDIQAIVLTPVRELALAVAKFIKFVGQFQQIKVQSCVGGTSIKQQKLQTKKLKPHIIVGTPGRILDHIQKKNINTDYLKIIVLDEADELLSKVFVQQIITMFTNVPADCQICLFSATYPPAALELTKKFMKQPFRISLDPYQVPVGSIDQFHIPLQNESQKIPTLLNLCTKLLIHHWIIFVGTNEKADQLGKKLNDFGVPITVIHSQKQQRISDLEQFKSGKTRILICTDIMGRGIDIASVSLVINFDMPNPRAALTQYIHRIGRCGRFGRSGVAISFVLQQDQQLLRKLRKLYHVQIEELPHEPKKIAPWLAPNS